MCVMIAFQTSAEFREIKYIIFREQGAFLVSISLLCIKKTTKNYLHNNTAFNYIFSKEFSK